MKNPKKGNICEGRVNQIERYFIRKENSYDEPNNNITFIAQKKIYISDQTSNQITFQQWRLKNEEFITMKKDKR